MKTDHFHGRSSKGLTAVAVGLMASLALVGCGGAAVGTSPQPGGGGGPSAGKQAFQTGLYAFVAPSNSCALCHSTVQAPFFASANLDTAYDAAKGLVDFSNPTNSHFIAYATNNHCGIATLCGANSGNGTVVQDDLMTWAAAEMADVSPGGGTDGGDTTPTGPNYYFTATMPIPAPADLPNLMSATKFMLRFELKDMKPAVDAFSNAILEIEVVAPNSTEYRLSSPKIAGNTAAVEVKGVHVYVKPSSVDGIGSEDTMQGLTWVGDDATIAISTRPATLPTGPLTVTPFDTRAIALGAYNGSNVLNDRITVGIEVVTPQ